MTPKQYEERNAKGYEGDTFIHGEIEKLVKKFTINNIVETGSYHGATTKRLTEFCSVISFEINNDNYEIASKVCEGKRALILNEDSIKGLSHYAPLETDKTLFFLDAHWWDHCPLLEELKIISGYKEKPVIVIHDFKVPNKDFGFDSYKGQDFTFEWIKPSIEAIYGQNYDYHYNNKADGGYRGIIYIYPKL